MPVRRRLLTRAGITGWLATIASGFMLLRIWKVIQIGGDMEFLVSSLVWILSLLNNQAVAVVIFIVGVALILFALWRPEPKQVEIDTEHFEAIKTQLKRLSRFELFALLCLVTNHKMTGSEFFSHLDNLGFPIENLLQQRRIESTFEKIGKRVSFIVKDTTTEDWSINRDDVPYVKYILKQLEPIIR